MDVSVQVNGRLLSAVHGRLRAKKIGCAEVASYFVKRLAVSEGPTARALDAIAKDADASGVANAYHNPAHSREVAVNWFCLAQLHNAAAADDDKISDDMMLVGLSAAFGHDLGHDGHGNSDPATGRYRPFHLEALAADRVADRMRKEGVSDGLTELARCAILLTDARCGYPILERSLAESPLALDPDFRPLSDPAGRRLCAMLRDADLMPSAGMTAGDYDARTREMLIEQDLPANASDAASTERFLDGLVGGRFLSAPGKAFQADLDDLRRLNQQRQPGRAALADDAGQIASTVNDDELRGLIETLGLADALA